MGDDQVGGADEVLAVVAHSLLGSVTCIESAALLLERADARVRDELLALLRNEAAALRHAVLALLQPHGVAVT